MNLLALDTSSIACTVAAQVAGKVFARHEEQARQHTHLLVPMIREVLHDSGADLSDLDAIVLGNGPGSFIGMRIAASVAQGLAYGVECKIIPVSSMAAVAANVFATEGAREVIVAQDAHMNEVYLGIYGRGEHGLPTLLQDERLQGQDAIVDLDERDAKFRYAAGQGWHRYPRLRAANKSLIGIDSGIIYPRAEYLLALAPSGAAVLPEHIEPAYLRQEVAEKPAAPMQ